MTYPEAKVLTDLLDFIGAVADVARGGTPRKPRIAPSIDPALKTDVLHQLVNAFVQRPFDIVVPGTHNPRLKGGRKSTPIAAQSLFAILDVKHGMPFLNVNKTMRDRMRVALLIEYEKATEVPLLLDFEMSAQDSVIETVRGRMDGRLSDVRIRVNRYLWAKYKSRMGYNSRHGMMTGPGGGSLYAMLGRARCRYTRGR